MENRQDPKIAKVASVLNLNDLELETDSYRESQSLEEGQMRTRIKVFNRANELNDNSNINNERTKLAEIIYTVKANSVPLYPKNFKSENSGSSMLRIQRGVFVIESSSIEEEGKRGGIEGELYRHTENVAKELNHKFIVTTVNDLPLCWLANSGYKVFLPCDGSYRFAIKYLTQ